MDARRGREAHRASLPEGRGHRRRWSQERPDLERYKGRKLTVIAWLWARTVKSPNPAFADVEVPLASTFMLSTKKGQGGVCRAGDRGAGVPVHGEGGDAAGCGGGEGRDEAFARGEFPVPDVGNADHR